MGTTVQQHDHVGNVPFNSARLSSCLNEGGGDTAAAQDAMEETGLNTVRRKSNSSVPFNSFLKGLPGARVHAALCLMRILSRSFAKVEAGSSRGFVDPAF
jgi:hypothetical protein